MLEGDHSTIIQSLRNKKSYELINFSNSNYHKFSIETERFNNQEFVISLVRKWHQRVKLWNQMGISNIQLSASVDEAILMLRSQLLDDDVFTTEPLSESSRVVLRPCGHMSDEIGYMNGLLRYSIYRMNRLDCYAPYMEMILINIGQVLIVRFVGSLALFYQITKITGWVQVY